MKTEVYHLGPSSVTIHFPDDCMVDLSSSKYYGTEITVERHKKQKTSNLQTGRPSRKVSKIQGSRTSRKRPRILR